MRYLVSGPAMDRLGWILDGLNSAGLYPLKADALLAEQRAQSLVADVVDHPLSHQELRQLRQAPSGKRQIMLGRPGLGDLLDLPPLRKVNFGGRPPLYFG